MFCKIAMHLFLLCSHSQLSASIQSSPPLSHQSTSCPLSLTRKVAPLSLWAHFFTTKKCCWMLVWHFQPHRTFISLKCFSSPRSQPSPHLCSLNSKFTCNFIKDKDRQSATCEGIEVQSSSVLHARSASRQIDWSSSINQLPCGVTEWNYKAKSRL